MRAALTAPLTAALTVLDTDMPNLLGSAVTLLRPHSGGDPPRLLAARGVGAVMDDLQAAGQGGPVPAAADSARPVLSADLWADERWRPLRLSHACAAFPQHRDELGALNGVAALPCLADHRNLVVLSAYLSRAPDPVSLSVLARYERLVAATVAVISTLAGHPPGSRRVLEGLTERLALDRATGIVLALCRSTPAEAEALLRDVADRAGLTAAELAEHLIVHVSGRHSDPAAAELWSALLQEHQPG
ncbi:MULTISPECIES: ANTAR domain-containing protein [unclassified Crossiella]|uniref:ANTAR domain-containing protein n=1 Tax=unclassified Crossiella TaxID=2620835 RepID=UPI0020004EC2|nr:MULTISPECIES: ANTAR domain-containing protein [unclassified Crossiella]MCK2244386.1 ANTAR domain-containing protein [Crossiella sp. S99.2]MCK2257786.1 ANTAR domain-containing protein [Crossiella sp. S99.1]